MNSIAEQIQDLCEWVRSRPESAVELAKEAGLTRNALRRVKDGEQDSFRPDTIRKLEKLRIRKSRSAAA